MNINKYRKLQFILKYRVTVLIISIGKLKEKIVGKFISERGDVPGWVLVVLMTTGLVTAIWTIAAPRLSAILRNSLDAMNNIK
ncbi:unannotated protein [freshwater metagenome]|jgi:uncharacterized membrane protein YqjE|uniref:Unannotated protein n=1 Tax=freshwater metagenome TaxID=449393 RepID=A0A6J7JFK1_9ZZZZ